MYSFADQVTDFLFNLQLPFALPEGMGVLDVHKSDAVQQVCKTFYKKFYDDAHKRHLLIGINPGRFGGGVTGIPFTDPVRLENNCGIENVFPKKQELSSVFMYDMITSYGGAAAFYKNFYISSVSPLGFIKEAKNFNYYDDKALLQLIEPFAVNCIQQQLNFGLQDDICFCIGEGKNLLYLRKLNEKYTWFKSIVALPHPRFIMQYKLKQKAEYIAYYLQAFAQLNV